MGKFLDRTSLMLRLLLIYSPLILIGIGYAFWIIYVFHQNTLDMSKYGLGIMFNVGVVSYSVETIRLIFIFGGLFTPISILTLKFFPIDKV